MLSKVNINTVKTTVQFSMTDMEGLVKTLESYFAYVGDQGKTLLSKKSQLAGVWLDSQYKTFSDYIDGVVGDINKALQVLDDYRAKLDAKLKELS